MFVQNKETELFMFPCARLLRKKCLSTDNQGIFLYKNSSSCNPGKSWDISVYLVWFKTTTRWLFPDVIIIFSFVLILIVILVPLNFPVFLLFYWSDKLLLWITSLTSCFISAVIVFSNVSAWNMIFKTLS